MNIGIRIALLTPLCLVGCFAPERLENQQISELRNNLDRYKTAVETLTILNKQLEDRNKELEGELAVYKAQTKTPSPSASPSP